MNCKEWNKQFNAITEAWTSQEDGGDTARGNRIPEVLLEHAKACPGCKARLEGFLRLSGNLGWNDTASPWLVERMSATVLAKIREKKEKQRFPVWAVSMGSIAVLLVMVSLAAGTFLFRLLPAAETSSGYNGDEAVVVRFVLEAPSAAKVAVVGDWNGWNPEADTLSVNRGEGTWELEIKLVPGREYRYQFLIDGQQWMPDPKSILQVDDGFGSINSILDI
jgi:hypothetical protein